MATTTTPLRRSKRRKIDNDDMSTTARTPKTTNTRLLFADDGSSSDEAEQSSAMKTPLPFSIKKSYQERDVVVIESEEESNNSDTNSNTIPVVTSSSNSSSDVDDDNNQQKNNSIRVVTPLDGDDDDNDISPKKKKKNRMTTTAPPPSARRSLFKKNDGGSGSSSIVMEEEEEKAPPSSSKKKRLIFGKYAVNGSNVIKPPKEVKSMYSMIQKRTGMIGGNGSHGPIYGELTMGSMQKMINLMKEYTNFNSDSMFLDVGSGVGKPNLHVTQDPGVTLSCGIEMEYDRWRLSMICLHHVLQEYNENHDNNNDTNVANNNDNDTGDRIQQDPIRHHNNNKCIFIHGNIMAAKTFNPFTHVYMFSIGFPPPLWCALAKIWNHTIQQQQKQHHNNTPQTKYLICFHAPREIIQKYGFHVRLVQQTNQSLSMHGSKEGHKGYIYAAAPPTAKPLSSSPRTSSPRRGRTTAAAAVKCDDVFADAYETIVLKNDNLQSLYRKVETQLNEHMESGRGTRSATKKRGLVLSKT